MSYSTIAKCVAASFAVSSLTAGCGLSVPQLHEPWEDADVDDDLAYRIKSKIYCEFRQAVSEIGPQQTYFRGRPVDKIPDNWGAQLTITLQIDETSSLSPTGSYNQVLKNKVTPVTGNNPIITPQRFSLPFTTNISSQAVRVDKYYTFYVLKNLKKRIATFENACNEPSENGPRDLDLRGSSYLFGSLGIRDWLKGAMRTQDLPSSDLPQGQSNKFEVLSYDIRFVVVTSGSVNPTWQLVNVSTALGSNPFFSTNRTRTHQLLLTIGPTDKTRSMENTVDQLIPSRSAQDLHLTGEIQQAISNGFRSALQVQY